MTLMHVLRGHKNRNWPIKSSFWCGAHFDYKQYSKQKRVLAAAQV